jgi:hypothetical protein
MGPYSCYNYDAEQKENKIDRAFSVLIPKFLNFRHWLADFMIVIISRKIKVNYWGFGVG